MPVSKRPQTDPLLWSLIAFVALFIVATSSAIVFYIKFEDQKAAAETAQRQLNDVASPSEIQKIGALIGTEQQGKSRLATVLGYLDQTIALITPGPATDSSAEVKVDMVRRKVQDTFAQVAGRQPVAGAAPQQPPNEFVELLAKEQFAKVVESFDPNMKTALPADKLEQLWKATIEQTGAFKRQLGSRSTKELDTDLVLVTCAFEKGPMDIKLVYDDKKQIAGLWFVPTPEDVLAGYEEKLLSKTPAGGVVVALDPNSVGLIGAVERIKAALDVSVNATDALNARLDQLQKRFDDALAAGLQKEQILLAEKETFQQQVEKVQSDYDGLRATLEKSGDERAKDLMAKLDQERLSRDQTSKELLKTQAELKAAQDRIQRVLQENVYTVKPPPDAEAAAFKPDGKVILVDSQAKIAHLNIGSDDHVYRGLTFSVYEKNQPIPKDGKGKAEIEVYSVDKGVSVAAITRANSKNPIVVDDVIANLIWDGSRANSFVVAGEFDLNKDGDFDVDAIEKIAGLIRKWGGTTTQTVSVNTDFVVLGEPPIVPRKPTLEELEVYPDAMEKYDRAVARLDAYNKLISQAQSLSVPVFNADRFLYFIGYTAQATRPGAF